MPRLIVLNGPPATGKSTLAERYVQQHALALNLDIDRIRDLIGGWRDNRHDAGLLARAAALAAARVHLSAGHDVVVPQLLARPGFLDQAAELAAEAGATFHEIVLMDTRENTLRRWTVRATARGGGADAAERDEVAALYDRLREMLATRPCARIVPSRENQIHRTYQEFLTCLRSP